MRKKVAAGNWKMNTLPEEGVRLASDIAAGRGKVSDDVEIVVAPPFTHLWEVCRTVEDAGVSVAAQDCAEEEKGAYTGEISAAMIAATGARYVILGHSERRQYFDQNGPVILKKMRLAFAHGLGPIFCIGENLDQREAGQHFGVVKRQLEEVILELEKDEFAKVIIAYEPVWAIGTGQTATTAEAQQMHKHIRDLVKDQFGRGVANKTAILYGGSVKVENAAELFACPDVDGGLVGGAALDAAGFLAIAGSFE